MFKVGQIVDVIGKDGEKEENLYGEVTSVTEDTVYVKPHHSNKDLDALAQGIFGGMDDIPHKLDGTAFGDGNEGWSIKARADETTQA